MSDSTDKMSGKAKEVTGKMTDNKKLETKGKVQRNVAEFKQKTRTIL